jgi:3-deoxy-D-arabino-heptulosonate 7-phosphate (DAHP) synthase
MKNRHEQLLQQGIPVLVIIFANLLFDEQRTLRRISKFLPCSSSGGEEGAIHAHFIPKLGVDVFSGNGWKVRGSVHSFGQSKDPEECCGYDSSTSTCVDRTLYKTIPEFEDRLVELEAYFRKYTLMEVADDE